jgi:hypothetical protein
VLLARRLYELSAQKAGGTLRLLRDDGSTAPVTLELQEGWVHAIELSPAYGVVGQQPARGEERLVLLLKLHAQGYGKNEFLPGLRARRGACSPFHPAAIVRNHVDALRPDSDAVRARVGLGTVQAPRPPHNSCLGKDERPVVALMSRPRTFEELDRSGLCAPERISRLCLFLDAVGALLCTFAPGDSPYAALELADHAPEEDVKRAFRRLAKDLHPDRHPGASADERAELARRFALVNAAYRRLV